MRTRLFLLFVLLPFISTPLTWAAGTVISANAGRVGERIFTSREVMLAYFVEAAVAAKGTAPLQIQLKADNIKGREFIRQTTALLLEAAIAMEAESFGTTVIGPAAIDRQVQEVQKKLKKVAAWKALDIEPQELREVVTRKLRAQSFIKFKLSSTTLPVSEQEAEDYFNDNRMKFENLPFATFKENIKSFLAKQQTDKRLKNWFELLQSKYQVRNYLAE